MNLADQQQTPRIQGQCVSPVSWEPTMLHRVRCYCAGRPSCRLCGGTTFYGYEPTSRGWLPFRCPTSDGRGHREEFGLDPECCPTCRGNGSVDPADPPLGLLVVIRKCLFGG